VPNINIAGWGSIGDSDQVLLAEDNAINQRVAVAMLRHLGFGVDVVDNGADAVEAATLRPYRAILMDCQIPGLDGYQATSEIRRLQGTSRHTPIIAVTGSATRSDQQRCLAAGMDDYLAKPLRLKALVAVLARWPPQGSPAGTADAPAVVSASDIDPGQGADSSRTVLDARIVARLERLGVAAGEDLMGQLTAMFLADAHERIGAMRLACAEGDSASITRSAHTLSGSSANVGATELSRLCAVLAQDNAAADTVARGELVDEIEAELGRVRFALGALVVPA
jgi:two-component system, sensor histidine kinase and response regulator